MSTTNATQTITIPSTDSAVSTSTPPTNATELWDQYVKSNPTFNSNMKRCLTKTFTSEDTIDELNQLPKVMCDYSPPNFITDYYLLPKNVQSIKENLESYRKGQIIRFIIQGIIAIALVTIALKSWK